MKQHKPDIKKLQREWESKEEGKETGGMEGDRKEEDTAIIIT